MFNPMCITWGPRLSCEPGTFLGCRLNCGLFVGTLLGFHISLLQNLWLFSGGWYQFHFFRQNCRRRETHLAKPTWCCINFLWQNASTFEVWTFRNKQLHASCKKIQVIFASVVCCSWLSGFSVWVTNIFFHIDLLSLIFFFFFCK